MRLPGFNPTDRGYRVDGRPTVAIIGSREMPVQCARLLDQAGFELVLAHSPDAPLREWAETHPVDFLPDFAAFRACAETFAIDYLFSVQNFRLLPRSLIESPMACAINYHDAPLPKYAGSHATAWALHNGERTHGVSWHVMVEKVDAGDLLAQVTFPIPEGATRDWLDQRCYLAAMRSFQGLLPSLKTETFTRTPQDLSQRTFYAHASKPAH